MSDSNDYIDPEDYKTIIKAVLRQGMDDYIKLQNPKFRSKKYIQEAFDSSVEMFFNSNYKMLHLLNEYGEPMSLKDMMTTILEDDRVSGKNIQNHLIRESRSFWETKLVRTLYVPDSFIYDGHVYSVYGAEDAENKVCFEEKEIYINKELDSETELEFVKATIDIIHYHEDIKTAAAGREVIAKAIYRMLKVNSCFTGS